METIVVTVHFQDMETSQTFVNDSIGASAEFAYWRTQGAQVELSQFTETTDSLN